MSINFEVKFADNVQQLREHLASGLDGIETTRAAMDKLARSLGGENTIKAAHNLAAAIQKLGGEAGALAGVEKLTFTELERANATLDRSVQKYLALGQAIPKPIEALHQLIKAEVDAGHAAEEAARNQKTLGDRVAAIGSDIAKTAAGYITAQAILSGLSGAYHTLSGFLEDSVKSAGDAEKAHVQVAAALKAQGTAVPSVISAYQDYAEALQNTTIFSDDAIEASEALLVQIGNVMPRDMEKALKATTELASGLGIDLHQATLLVAKAAEGNTAALKKAGVVIDETAAKSGDFGVVLDAITDKFGGQAAAIASTYQGRLLQLANSWDNVKESVGRVITQNETLLSAFDLLNRQIVTNTGELNKNSTATNLVSDAVLLSVQGVKLFAETLDLVQTGGAAFVIGLRSIAKGLDYVAIASLEALKASAWLTGDFAGVSAANAAIGGLTNRIKEFDKSNETTTGHSVAFGMALDRIGEKADALNAALVKTRGNTVAVQTATDKGSGAWDRHTQAVLKTGKAVKDVGLAFVGPIEALKNWGHQLDLIQGKASQWELKTLDVVDAAKLLGTSLPKPEVDALLATNFEGVMTVWGQRLHQIEKDFRNVKLSVFGLEEEVIPTLNDIGQRLTKAKTHTDAFGSSLSRLANDFVQMSQIGGDSFSPFMRQIGLAVKAGDQLFNSLEQLSKSTGPGGSAAIGAAAFATNWIGAFTAVYAFYQQVQQIWASEAAEEFARQQKISALELAKSFDSVGNFTDSLTRSVEELSKSLMEMGFVGRGSLARFYAEALNLPKIIEELGGASQLTAAQLEDVEKHIRGLFEIINTDTNGAISVRATKALDESLTAIGTAAAANGGLVDKFFLDMAAKARAAGIELKGVQEFMQGQALNAETGIGGALKVTNDAYAKRADLEEQIMAISAKLQGSDATNAAKVADLRKRQAHEDAAHAAKTQEEIDALNGARDSELSKLDALNKALENQQKIIDVTSVHSQAAAEAVSGSLLSIINSQVAAGKSYGDAIRDVAPSIQSLQHQLTDAGISGGQAFDILNAQVALFTDDVAGPALQSIEGYAKGLVGLNNAGLLNQDTFAGISEQIRATRDALVAQGKDGGQVLQAMRGPLQTLWELEQKFGYTTDQSTQDLINQAQAQGLVGDKFKSAADQQLDATLAIKDAVVEMKDAFLEAFGIMPKAAKDAATGISNELERIKTPTIRIPIDFPHQPGDLVYTDQTTASGRYDIRDFGLSTPTTSAARAPVITDDEVQAMTRAARSSVVPIPADDRPIVIRNEVVMTLDGEVLGRYQDERLVKDPSVRSQHLNALGLA